MTSEHDDELDEESLVSVREVQDEATATLLCDFLRSQGIEASAVSSQIPWLSTIETMHQGHWGKVEVLGKDAARARALIEDFLNATPQSDPNEETS
jgi:hypothetical protein